ncbi:MAG: hypoxanthine-guanine phosphoribosyltransferase [Gammaproteobacteria bacterium]|nr:hypoxanthine-guanine phosphoribosyltransferase [Gammaproteobacteria bacterium]
MPSITAEKAQQVLSRSECIYDDATVQSALDGMADKLRVLLESSNPIVMCLMTGGLIATSELMLRLEFPLELDYIHATRYGNQTAGNELEWKTSPHKEIKGREILIIDDILDEGYTLKEIIQYCRAEGAKKVYTAVLVEKEHDRRAEGIEADVVGLKVPDRYVFGYGMDYKGFLRNVAGIHAAHKDDE